MNVNINELLKNNAVQRDMLLFYSQSSDSISGTTFGHTHRSLPRTEPRMPVSTRYIPQTKINKPYTFLLILNVVKSGKTSLINTFMVSSLACE